MIFPKMKIKYTDISISSYLAKDRKKLRFYNKLGRDGIGKIKYRYLSKSLIILLAMNN